MVAVEKDRRFLPMLSLLAEASEGRLTIVHNDILAVDLRTMKVLRGHEPLSANVNGGASVAPWAVAAAAAVDGGHHTHAADADTAGKTPASSPPPSPPSPSRPAVHIIGNLPFNIATPLLMRWLATIGNATTDAPLPYPASLTLCFQKEVGDVRCRPPLPGVFFFFFFCWAWRSVAKGEGRIRCNGRAAGQHGGLFLFFPPHFAQRMVAAPGTAQRTRLSVMTQAFCRVRTAFHIPGGAFLPPPKVDASVLVLVRWPRVAAVVVVVAVVRLWRWRSCCWWCWRPLPMGPAAAVAQWR